MTDVDAADEMTLRDYASVVWRRKWFVVVPAVLTTLVALVLSLAQTPMYRASADVLVKPTPSAFRLPTTGGTLDSRTIGNELEAAAGSTLQAAVRATVGNEPTLDASAGDGTDVITFTATSDDPDRAAAAANAYAIGFIEQQRATIINDYELRIEALREQLAAIELDGGDESLERQYEAELADLVLSIDLAGNGGSELIDEATPPGRPFEPTTTRTVVLALVVGLLIGLGAAFLVDYLDTSIRDEDDLVRAIGLPVLTTVPAYDGPSVRGPPQLEARVEPNSAAAEAFNALHTSLRFMTLDRQIRTLLVTSAVPGDGKTTVATNLAYTAARAGDRVLLVDCDFRKPQVHLVFGLSNHTGFTSVLLGDESIGDVARPGDPDVSLAVVTAGPRPPHPSDLLASARTRQSLAEIAKEVDLIVLDSPPVLPVADPLAVAPLVDGVIVVASAGVTDRRQLAKTAGRLREVDAPVLGTVLNRHAPAGSGYDYGYEAEPAGSPQAQPPTVTDVAAPSIGTNGHTSSTWLTPPGATNGAIDHDERQPSTPDVTA